MPYTGGSRFGGNLDEFPEWEQNLRSVLFPDYKRHVEVRITTWMGVSLGAVHYYVTFDVEGDPVLVPNDKGGYTEWESWDYPKKYKRYKVEGTDYYSDFVSDEDDSDEAWEKFKDQFMDLEFTKQFAKDQVAKHFPEDKWFVTYNNDGIGEYGEEYD